MKYLIWGLWILCVVLVVGGGIGYFFFSGQVVDTAKSCAGVAADVCDALPATTGMSAGKSGLVVIGGVLCGVFAYIFGQDGNK